MKKEKNIVASTVTAESPARERIAETALKLFYKNGVRATGIDRIIAESGVAKMSFYRHFPSKDDLVSEFLRRRHAVWMGWFEQAVESRLAKHATLAVIADALEEWFESEDFRGCAFINTTAELPDFDSEQSQLVREHKLDLERYVRAIAKRLKLRRVDAIAAEVMIVIEGTIVRLQMMRDRAAVKHCREMLRRIEGA